MELKTSASNKTEFCHEPRNPSGLFTIDIPNFIIAIERKALQSMLNDKFCVKRHVQCVSVKRHAEPTKKTRLELEKSLKCVDFAQHVNSYAASSLARVK